MCYSNITTKYTNLIKATIIPLFLITLVACSGGSSSSSNSPDNKPSDDNKPIITEFVMTWETTVDNELITIPTKPGRKNIYDYNIDWGDGNSDESQAGDVTHNYATAGIHVVKISGDFPQIFFNNKGDKDKIKSIENWGNIAWFSMEKSFLGCSDVILKATDSPDLSAVTSLKSMFKNATNLGSADLNNWGLSTITDTSAMFLGSNFNGNVDRWDVSSVKKMANMFKNAKSFTGHDLSGWDVSSVTDNANFSSGWGINNIEPAW
jgi:surface protein